MRNKKKLTGGQAAGILGIFSVLFVALVALGAALTLVVWNVCQLDELVEINFWQALGINLLLGSAGYNSAPIKRRNNG